MYTLPLHCVLCSNVKSITEITKRELEMGVAEPGRSSWHDDYRGSAYVFVGMYMSVMGGANWYL